MPQPPQGPNSWETDMPRPVWGFSLQVVDAPQPDGSLNPELGTPVFQVATILGRIRFRKMHL